MAGFDEEKSGEWGGGLRQLWWEAARQQEVTARWRAAKETGVARWPPKPDVPEEVAHGNDRRQRLLVGWGVAATPFRRRERPWFTGWRKLSSSVAMSYDVGDGLRLLPRERASCMVSTGDGRLCGSHALKGFWMVVAVGSDGDVAWEGQRFLGRKPKLFRAGSGSTFWRRNLLGDVGVVSSSFPWNYSCEICPTSGTCDGDTLGIVTSLEVSFEVPFPLISNLDDLSSYDGASGMAMLAGLHGGEWMHPSLSPRGGFTIGACWGASPSSSFQSQVLSQ
uniref:Uncharacterized protein n=1 Tax=Oryza meridionalis TaxID=40149 RepID=A0A0E0DMQ4_9ORYZ